jgi:hypothetical protein
MDIEHDVDATKGRKAVTAILLWYPHRDCVILMWP